jgi:hypothetical protein
MYFIGMCELLVTWTRELHYVAQIRWQIWVINSFWLSVLTPDLLADILGTDVFCLVSDSLRQWFIFSPPFFFILFEGF